MGSSLSHSLCSSCLNSEHSLGWRSRLTLLAMVNPSDPGAAADDLGRLLGPQRGWDGAGVLAWMPLSPKPPVGLVYMLAGSPVMGPGWLSVHRELVPLPERTSPSHPEWAGGGGLEDPQQKAPQGLPKMAMGALGLEIQAWGPPASNGGAFLGKREETSQFDPQSEPPPSRATAPYPLGHAGFPWGVQVWASLWTGRSVGTSEARVEGRYPRSS